jgi:hypothetical protein
MAAQVGEYTAEFSRKVSQRSISDEPRSVNFLVSNVLTEENRRNGRYILHGSTPIPYKPRWAFQKDERESLQWI